MVWRCPRAIIHSIENRRLFCLKRHQQDVQPWVVNQKCTSHLVSQSPLWSRAKLSVSKLNIWKWCGLCWSFPPAPSLFPPSSLPHTSLLPRSHPSIEAKPYWGKTLLSEQLTIGFAHFFKTSLRCNPVHNRLLECNFFNQILKLRSCWFWCSGRFDEYMILSLFVFDGPGGPHR